MPVLSGKGGAVSSVLWVAVTWLGDEDARADVIDGAEDNGGVCDKMCEGKLLMGVCATAWSRPARSGWARVDGAAGAAAPA